LGVADTMKVFISYRRGDAVALAGRLYDRLGSRVGVDSVFSIFSTTKAITND